jgi:hexosaminidase
MKLAGAFLLLTGAAAYQPWPQPASLSVGTTVLSVDPSLSFTFQDGTTSPGKLLAGAFDRYADSIANGFACAPDQREILAEERGVSHPSPSAASAVLSNCVVSIHGDEEPDVTALEDVDESYSLEIGADGACSISAETGFGALRALESLAGFAGEACVIENAPIKVSDSPRFNFRGLMIDSARHFLPVSFIEHIIDTMAGMKLNVLHWHISDTESFPSGSELFPELAQKGSYAYPDAAYTLDDLKHIVSYAYDRGVRVMPEWDMPGHGAWGFGKPEVMINDNPACTNTMDPTKQTTYDFLKSFLGEMAAIFPDMYVFLGGDEVDQSCFSGSPTVAAWMADNGIADGAELQSYFWQQITKQVMPELDKTLGVWMADDGIPYPEDLPEGSFGNVWQSQSMMPGVIDRGAKVVLSGPWYLDQQQPGGFSTYSLQAIWTGMYKVEPYDGLNATQQTEVLGGQACMWGEGVNWRDFDAYAVTKTAAVAERLWSPVNTTDIDDAHARLAEHVCRLNMRGVAAEAITQNFCLADL